MRKSRGCVALAVLVALTIGSPMLGLSAQTGTPLSQAAIAEGVRAARHDAAERAALAAMDAYLETWNTRARSTSGRPRCISRTCDPVPDVSG